MDTTPNTAPVSQNDHVRTQLVLAQRCAERLAARGLTVLSIAIEGHKPRIWIMNSARTAILDGGMMVRRTGPMGIEEIMAADVDGCQVHWRVVGH